MPEIMSTPRNEPFKIGPLELIAVSFDDYPDTVFFGLKKLCQQLEIASPSRAREWIDPEDLAYALIPTESNRIQRTLMVAEPGLYALALKSKSETARKFQDWLFTEVLPNTDALAKFGDLK